MECEAYGRLGIEWINIAQRGVRSHPGVRIDDQFAIVLFDRPATGETIAALWSFGQCAAVTSETMSFPLGMLFDWDWRAERVEAAVSRLRDGLQRDFNTDTIAPAFR